MAGISYVEKEQASPEVRMIYAESEKAFGCVLNFFKAMAHAPDMVQGFMFLYDKLHHLDLDPKLRELAYLMSSKVNGCQY